MNLVNMKDMTQKAYKNKYAVPHMNINNLEWTKAVLLACEEVKSPVILGTSEGAIKYMGGFSTIVGMVNGLMENLGITVPVALHLDHGSFEGAKKAIAAGYTSVMYDGSHEDYQTNLENAKEIVKLAKSKKVSVECEVGTIGGEEDGIIGNGDIASPQEAKEMAGIGIDVLAAGIGNIHGPYPKSWKSLNFEALDKIRDAAGIPLVLHGGSGIPKDQVKKAISLGISKVNVNTELQLVFAAATRKYIESGKDKEGKGYDPRKLLAPGVIAIQAMVKQLAAEFGSKGKA